MAYLTAMCLVHERSRLVMVCHAHHDWIVQVKGSYLASRSLLGNEMGAATNESLPRAREDFIISKRYTESYQATFMRLERG